MGTSSRRPSLRKPPTGRLRALLESLEPRTFLTATSLAFATPIPDTVAGHTLPDLTVVVLDENQNLDTTANTQIDIAIAFGPGGLTNELLTTVTAHNGIATVSGLNLTVAGTYNLVAFNPDLQVGGSNGFNITPDAPVKLGFLTPPTDLFAGDLNVFFVGVLDQFGNVVTSVQSQFNFSISGPLTLNATPTITNGIAGLQLGFPKVGTYQFTATSDTYAAATPVSYNVLPAAPASFTITQQPANGIAGNTLAPVTVTVFDAFGNVTPDASPVTLSIVGTAGTLLGTTTLAVPDGTATFNDLSIQTAGTYSFSASDGNLSATTNSFTIAPNVADHLVFLQQPSGATAGTTLPAFNVAVFDQFGNLATGDTSEVTLAIASGVGTLHGTATASITNGIATFNNVSISRGGDFTLALSDGLLTPLVSDPFTIDANTASKLVVYQKPPAGAAGNLGTIVIAVADAAGNPVETDNGSNITLTIMNGKKVVLSNITATSVDGYASFPGLNIPAAGNYTILASTPGLASAAPATFYLGAKLAFQAKFTPTAAGQTLSTFTVLVRDSKNKPISDDNSPITLAVASGPGTPAGVLTVNAVNGVATFDTLSFQTAGSYTFQATSGTMLAANSRPFTVTPGAVTSLVDLSTLASATAGAKLPALRVQLLDAYGNVVTTTKQKFTLSLASGPQGASLSGALTVAPSKGILTFSNVVLKTAGDYTLTVAANGVSLNLTPLTIHAAAAKSLAFSQFPSQGTINTDLAPAIVVDILDAFGNLVTNSAALITLTVTSAPAGAQRPAPTATPINGHATFASLQLNLAGNYKFQASAPGLSAAVSSLVIS